MVFLTKLTKSESEIEMKKRINTWSVMTIQQEEGMEFEGIFITNNKNTLEKFASTLNPSQVCFSNYENEEQAKDFFYSYCYENINLNPYFFQKIQSKKIS